MATGDDAPYTYSVVVPVYNEAGTIEDCLDALLGTDYPTSALEILVADGGSEDRTREIVADYAEPVQLLDNPGKTTPHGLNVGLEASSKEIIVLISGHSRVEPSFFTELTAAFEREPEADVVGGVMVPEATGYRQRVVSAALTTPLGSSSTRFQENEGFVETVNFGAYKREVSETIGEFDTGLPRAQDYEYNRRVRKAGFRIYQTSSVRVYYTPRSSFAALARQYYGNGYWKAVVHDRFDELPASPDVLTTGGAVACLGVLLVGPVVTLGVVGLVGYVLALCWATRQAAAEIGPTEYPGIVLALAIMHWSYALGFLDSLGTLADQR
jgi:glycosyltransferase involved in cell wall biosynthesis